MTRFVVVFDLFNDEIKRPCQTVKLYNNPENCVNVIQDYCNKFHSKRYWQVISDPEKLCKAEDCMNAVLVLNGWNSPVPNTNDIPEIITLYMVKEEDPDEDPYRKFLLGMEEEAKKSLEENKDLDEEDKRDMNMIVDIVKQCINAMDHLEDVSITIN